MENYAVENGTDIDLAEAGCVIRGFGQVLRHNSNWKENESTDDYESAVACFGGDRVWWHRRRRETDRGALRETGEGHGHSRRCARVRLPVGRVHDSGRFRQRNQPTRRICQPGHVTVISRER